MENITSLSESVSLHYCLHYCISEQNGFKLKSVSKIVKGTISRENFRILKAAVLCKQFDWLRGVKITNSSPGG